ncbi:MAG: ABC transporter permease [Chloroflexota bacterium]|nr:MAG: ABC transporter permease [Chloroflexota bacterium]
MFGLTQIARHANGEIPWAFGQPLAVRTTLRRWRGTVGMILSVGGALGLVLMLLFMAEGSIWIYVQDYVESGTDLYITRRGGVMVPILPGEGPGTIKNARQAMGQIRGMPETRGVLGVVTWQLERSTDGPRRDKKTELVAVVGVEGDAEAIRDATQIRSGRWIRRPGEVVIGRKLAKEKGLAVGDTLTLDNRRLSIVGIGRLRGVGFLGEGTAFLDMATLRDLGGLSDFANIILVDASDPDAASRRYVENLDNIDVWDRNRLIEGAQAANASGMVFMGLISGIALFIAGVFVSSMLMRSVAERRIEFGTLRAVGVPNRTIIGIVIGEALLVTGAGAIVGAIVGTAMSVWLDRLYADILGVDTLYHAQATQYLAVTAIALVIGLLAGWFPARRALSVEPADVLREA